MKRIDYIVAWLIVLLGLRSGLASIRNFSETAPPWPTAFFLVTAGLLLATCGALNLLRIRYATVAPASGL